jgi:hypothetical protein
MPGLRFRFSELEKELVALEKLAARFLAPGSVDRLKELRSELKQIRIAPRGSRHVWEIALDRPLVTTASEGAYEPDGEGGDRIRAFISSRWDVVCVDPRGAGRALELSGIASTRVSLRKVVGDGLGTELKDAGDEIARWRMEIGARDGPGSYFHVQVLGEESDDVFPHSLPVPRLPTYLITPMMGVEFAIAELFQDKWKQHIAKQSHDRDLLRAIHQSRLEALFGWMKDQAKLSSAGSPILSLKTAVPDRSLFIA